MNGKKHTGAQKRSQSTNAIKASTPRKNDAVVSGDLDLSAKDILSLLACEAGANGRSIRTNATVTNDSPIAAQVSFYTYHVRAEYLLSNSMK